MKIRENPWRKCSQKQMRRRPAIGAASFVDLSSCLPAARGSGTMVLVRQRSPGVPLLPALAAESRFEESFLCRPCGGQRPNPLRRTSRRGGRNARATGSHSRAFPNFPRQLTLENCRLPPASPQTSLASFEICHVFAELTLVQNVASRNRKTFRRCAETVDGETSLWKPEENRARIPAAKMFAQTFQ